MKNDSVPSELLLAQAATKTKQEDLQARMQAAHMEIGKILEKYRVIIVPTLTFQDIDKASLDLAQ